MRNNQEYYFTAEARSAMSSKDIANLCPGTGPDYAVWNPNDDPGDGNINWYYDDVPADGGYNHFELRRYKRAYTLPGVFQKGQLAPPMDEAAQWLQNFVFDQ